jgi:hypothetical protein
MAQLLVDAGADLNVRNASGFTRTISVSFLYLFL